MPLNTTPGDPNANAYCSVAEADTYHTERLGSTDWTGATTANKEAAIIWATRLLDEQIDWDGAVAALTQALQWPRGGLIDLIGNSIPNAGAASIPKFLKNATAEYARQLITDSARTDDQATAGIKEIEVGSVDITFNEHTGGKPRLVVPDAVFEMIAPWGRRKYGSGLGAIKTVRT